MLAKTITTGSLEFISVESVLEDMCGPILVYENNVVIGYVHKETRDSCWIVTIYDFVEYANLEEIINEYPKYKFIYLID